MPIVNKRRSLAVVSIVIISILIIVFSYIQYQINCIERELDRASEDILLNSINDTEKVHKIIEWEKSLGLPYFESDEEFLRIPKDARWYILLQKANCRERAIIFEDMAKRNNLKYRKIVVDGFIDPRENRMANHRWSEVWLDNDWRIADSGFDASYPEDNLSYFTSDKGYLMGHVAIINDNGTFEDCTDSYVNKTSKLIIKAVLDDENVEDADVKIHMRHKNFNCRVIGYRIKISTNESGSCEINLGIYNGTYYNVSVSTGGAFTKYIGENSTAINNGKKNLLVVELQENIARIKVLTVLTVALIFCSYLALIVYIDTKVIGEDK